MTKKPEHADFAERLRQHLETGGYDTSRVELVKQLARDGRVAVTQQTISGWLSGKHLPKPNAVRGLALMLGIDPGLLLFGGKASGVREPRSDWPDYVSARDRNLFQEFLALPAKQREAVRQHIETLSDAAVRKQKRD